MDERTEELASLYALDLLESAESAAFEKDMAGNPALRRLVTELRNASSCLALTVSSPAPSAQLRERVLASAAARPGRKTAPATRPPTGKIIPFTVAAWMAWGVAACLALITAWQAQRSASLRREVTASQAVLELEKANLQTVRNQLDAERLIAQQQTRDLKNSQDEAGALRDSLSQERSQSSRRLTEAQAERDLARTEASRQLAELQAKYDRANSQANRQLAELQEKYDLANYKVARLAALHGHSPEATAIAVWNPSAQQGILTVQKLPALASDQDYQLWVIDPQYADPVDGGVFTVDPVTGEGRLQFRPKQPIAQAAKFAISRERKGGVPKPTPTAIVLLGQ